MTGADEPNAFTEVDESNDAARSGSSLWRFDPKIWNRKETPSGLSVKISRLPTKLGEALTSSGFLLFFLAPLGGLGAYLTFEFAYYLGGVNLFGAYFIGIWAGIIVGVVIVAEKTGYSKNFEGWDFPMRHVLFLPVAFAVVAGVILLAMLLTGKGYFLR